MNATDAGSITAPGEKAARWTFPEIVLCGVMLAFLVPNFSHALYCGYEQGWWPLKPRDFNLGLAGLAVTLFLLCRPTVCLMALAVLTIPLPRILDAALLRRYEILEYGGHETYVFTMISLWLISFVAVSSVGTSKGPKIAMAVAVAAIIACTGANLYEWLGYASWTLIPGRVAGWHLDPNNSPIVMCLMLGVLFTFNRSFWWNLVWASIAAVGIALTMSRSGMMVYFTMMSLYLLANLRERLVGIVALTLVAAPLVVGALSILGTSNSSKGIVKNEDTVSRMEAIYRMDFEKLKSPERKKDLLDAWEAVCARPVAGWGMGSGSLRWRPHNMFVSHWIDVGMVGIIHYAAALIAFTLCSALKGFRAIFCLLPIWLFIPCSQVLLEMPAYWFAWGVAAFVLFPKRYAFSLSKCETFPSARGETVPV